MPLPPDFDARLAQLSQLGITNEDPGQIRDP